MYRETPEQVVKFVTGMHKGIKPESNIDAHGQYYTLPQANSDQVFFFVARGHPSFINLLIIDESSTYIVARHPAQRDEETKVLHLKVPL